MPYILPDITESADAAASTATFYSLGIGQTAQGTISSLGDLAHAIVYTPIRLADANACRDKSRESERWPAPNLGGL